MVAANGGRAAQHWQDYLGACSTEMPGGSARARQSEWGERAVGYGIGVDLSPHSMPFFSHVTQKHCRTGS